MHRTTLLRAALVAAPLLLWAGPAEAQYDDPDGPVVVADTSLTFGQSVTVSGGGFDELTPVDVFLFSDPVKLATVTTDGNGAFSVTVTIPAGTPMTMGAQFAARGRTTRTRNQNTPMATSHPSTASPLVVTPMRPTRNSVGGSQVSTSATCVR